MNEKILIVDDEAEILRTLKFALRSHNYTVVTANNGQEALDTILSHIDQNNPFDLVITDIEMPIMKGSELLREVRQRDIETPVVALTGYGDKEIVVELLKSSCTDYFDKPIDTEKFLEKVKETLNEFSLKNDVKEKTQKLAEIGSFSAEIAHDISNIFSGTATMMEVLQQKHGKNHLINQYLESIKDSSVNAGVILKQLLLLSQSKELTPTTIDLRKEIRGLLDFIQMIATNQNGVEIITDNTPKTIQCDKLSIMRILVNLISNARNAMPKRGIIQVKIDLVKGNVNPDASEVRLSIKDSGVGMSAESIHTILSPTEVKNKTPNTNMGLSLVKRTVQKFNGTLLINSQENHGTEVIMHFPFVSIDVTDAIPVTINKSDTSDEITVVPPIKKMPEKTTTKEEPTVDTNSTVRKKFNHINNDAKRQNVILAGNSRRIQRKVSNIISQSSYSATVVNEETDFLDSLCSEEFNLIILQLDMQGFNGVQLAKLLRKKENEKNLEKVPIIAVTPEITSRLAKDILNVDIDNVILYQDLDEELISSIDIFKSDIALNLDL